MPPKLIPGLAAALKRLNLSRADKIRIAGLFKEAKNLNHTSPLGSLFRMSLAKEPLTSNHPLQKLANLAEITRFTKDIEKEGKIADSVIKDLLGPGIRQVTDRKLTSLGAAGSIMGSTADILDMMLNRDMGLRAVQSRNPLIRQAYKAMGMGRLNGGIAQNVYKQFLQE